MVRGSRQSKRRFAVDGKEPTTVIGIEVEQAFQHCPKALVRSNLWKAGSGDRPKRRPQSVEPGRRAAVISAPEDDVLCVAVFSKARSLGPLDTRLL